MFHSQKNSQKNRPNADKALIIKYSREIINKVLINPVENINENTANLYVSGSCNEQCGDSSQDYSRTMHLLYDTNELFKLIDEAEQQPDDVRRQMIKYLNQTQSLGNKRYLTKAPTVSDVGELRNNFPNFEKAIAAIERRAAISSLQGGSYAQLPILLLNGPPGIGKTTFARAVAKMSGAPFFQVSLSSATAGFTLGGLDLSWSSGRPGRIFSQLALSQVSNPVCLLDEVDKCSIDVRHSPIGPLFSLLEPDTARCWQDEAVPLKLDCSRIQWIATSNNIDTIDPAILSRFEIIEVSSPAASEARKISSKIYLKIIAEENINDYFEKFLTEDVLDFLSIISPRKMKSQILGALGKAVLENRRILIVADFEKNSTTKRIIGF